MVEGTRIRISWCLDPGEFKVGGEEFWASAMVSDAEVLL